MLKGMLIGASVISGIAVVSIHLSQTRAPFTRNPRACAPCASDNLLAADLRGPEVRPRFQGWRSLAAVPFPWRPDGDLDPGIPLRSRRSSIQVNGRLPGNSWQMSLSAGRVD